MEKKKKAMISQPMNGLSNEEIGATRAEAIKWLEEKGFEVIDTFFKDEVKIGSNFLKSQGVEQIPVYFLSKAIAKMAQCHAVYFCGGWEDARGCRIEHEIAEQYGLEIYYEFQDDVEVDEDDEEEDDDDEGPSYDVAYDKDDDEGVAAEYMPS